MSGLLELAARVEALSGPSLAIDIEIEEACVEPMGRPKKWLAMCYTSSLDAAMTLVPEGWTFANLSQSDRKGWWCELRRGFQTSYDKSAFGNQLENTNAAVAITAAALRARASLALDSATLGGDGS